MVNAINRVIDFTILFAKIGISTQNPNYNPLMDAIQGISNIISLCQIREVLTKLSQRIETLENKQISNQYLSSPQFVEEFKRLLYIQQCVDLKERKRLYANYFISCCCCTSVDRLNTHKYYSILENLDLVEYYILTILPCQMVASCNATSLYRCSKAHFTNISKEDVMMRLDSLVTRGVAKAVTYQDVKNKPNRFGNRRVRGEDEFYILTSLGAKFLSFISNDEK